MIEEWKSQITFYTCFGTAMKNAVKGFDIQQLASEE